MLFRGRSQRSLDAKGRLMLPPEFRDILLSRDTGGHVVLTTYDTCVVGFPLQDWEDFEARFNKISNPPRTVRDFRRLVLGGAESMVLDAQGRIRLSKDHLTYANIAADAVLVGQGRRFEMWDPQRLAPILVQDFDDVAQSLAASGIDFAF